MKIDKVLIYNGLGDFPVSCIAQLVPNMAQSEPNMAQTDI